MDQPPRKVALTLSQLQKKPTYLEKANSMHFYLKEIVSEETSYSTAAGKRAKRKVNAKQPPAPAAYLKPWLQTSHPKILDASGGTCSLLKGCTRNRLREGRLGARGCAKALRPPLAFEGA